MGSNCADIFDNNINNDSVEGLIISAKENENSLVNLLVHYQKWILNLSFQLSGDIGLSEDIRQEVSFKVFKYIGQFKGETEPSFKAWLRKLVINCYHDEMRKKSEIIDSDYISNIGYSVQVSADEYIDKREQLKKISNAISCLPIDFKTVLILRFQEELTYEEISETMNISLASVKTKIHRAKKLLYKNIEIGEDLYD